jgi:Domain of unknown function (DUF4287)
VGGEELRNARQSRVGVGGGLAKRAAYHRRSGQPVNRVSYLSEEPTSHPDNGIGRRDVRSIAEWQQVIAGCDFERHMEIVNYLKSEHGMGHGHANALVGWTLADNVASP